MDIKELERRRKALEKRLGRPLKRPENKPIDWSKVHRKENFYDLFDYSKPLLPQLQRSWRSCFYPEIGDQQLIKHVCPGCAMEGIYGSCLFYEAISLSKFRPFLEEILADETIKPPIFQHPFIRRLCRTWTPLEEILKATWPLMVHEKKKPEQSSPEYKKWLDEKKSLQTKLPCESTCTMREYCNFYINDFNGKLCVTTIESWDNDEVKVKFNHSTKTDKGYRVDSYLYKQFIKPTQLRELPPVRNDKSLRVLDDRNYKIYEKVFKVFQHQKKRKVLVFKGFLDVMMGQKEGLLEKLQSYRDMEGTFDYRTMRKFAQKHSTEFSDNADQLIEVDLGFWQEYVNQQQLEFSDVLYEWFLSQEKTPSRKELAEKFKITQPTQIAIEKKLGIKKDFRGIKGTAQFTNKYLTNVYVIGAIFKTLNRTETEKKLKTIIIRNKEKAKRKKLYTRENEPILSYKQLKQLETLYNQLTSN